MSNLSSIASVVHQEQLNIVGVENSELLEATGEQVLGNLVASKSDTGHLELTLESTSDSVINTLRLSPALLL